MEQKPLIVEFIGLPGVGKSTLVNELLKHSSKLGLEKTPFFREIEYLPFFTWNTFLSIPDFLRIRPAKNQQGLSSRDMALMAILKGWDLTLERHRSKSPKIIILDEGPICYLTRLYAFGSDALKGDSAAYWWNETCKKWAKTLDLIVMLDTADQKLIQRIRSRDMPQIVKEISDKEALKYIRNHRRAQEFAVNKIMTQPVPPKMVCFDTTQNPPRELAVDCLKLLSL